MTPIDIDDLDPGSSDADEYRLLKRLLESGEWERMTLQARLYVALSLEREDLLLSEGISSLEALAYLPDRWGSRLAQRWVATLDEIERTIREAIAWLEAAEEPPDPRKLH